MIDSFINFLRGVSGKSEGTIKEYERNLKEFVEFVQKDIKEIEKSDVYNFMGFLQSKGNSAATRSAKLSAIKSFFKHLKSVGMIEDNVADDIEKPKIERKIPKVFNIEDVGSLVENIHTRNYLRDRLIISLFLSTGCRLSELVGINLTDIKGNELTLRGKGNKQRKVYLTETLQAYLQDYIKIRPRLKDSALFVSERGNRVHKTTIQRLIKTVFEHAGIEGSTHTLRHTCATLMYDNGEDLRTIQEALGHADLSTTQIYTHVSNKKVKDAIVNNPVNSLL